MNIFDGHENKTSEELAAELGISDLSIVNNAGRETLKTLNSKIDIIEGGEGSIEQKKVDYSLFNSFLLLTEDEIVKKSNWISLEKYLGNLEEGMRIKGVGVGKVMKINSDHSIHILFSDGSTLLDKGDGENISHMSIYIEDTNTTYWPARSELSDDNLWINHYDINNLDRNMIVRRPITGRGDEYAFESFIILDISLEENKIKIKNSGGTILQYDFNDFFSIFDIYHENFEPVLIKKLGYQGNWTSAFSIADIKKDMYVMKNGYLYKILDIDGSNIYVGNYDKIKGPPTELKPINFYSELQTNYKILKLREDDDEIRKELGIRKEQLLISQDWEINYEIDDIKVGMRVNRHKGIIGGRITAIKNQYISVQLINGVIEEFDIFDDFYSKYCVYFKDMINLNFEENLGNLKKDEKRVEIYTIDELKIDMEIRSQSDNKKILGKILDIVDDYITINYYEGVIQTLSFEYLKTFNNQILKGDLENEFSISNNIPRNEFKNKIFWTDDFLIEDLEIGMILRHKIIGTMGAKIVNINEENIIVKRSNGEIETIEKSNFKFSLYDNSNGKLKV